jgi:hypothetical protein
MEFAVVEGWRRLLGEWRYQLGRGCRNAEEPASVRSFARSKGSSAVNHLPDFHMRVPWALALFTGPEDQFDRNQGFGFSSKRSVAHVSVVPILGFR